MKIKSIGYLMLLGSILASHVIGFPMDQRQGVGAVTKETSRKLILERAQAGFDKVRAWLGKTKVPEGLCLGVLNLSYDPSEEGPFNTWAAQINLANQLLDVMFVDLEKKGGKKIHKNEVEIILTGLLETYFACVKGGPPSDSLARIREHGHMARYSEVFGTFLDMMLRVLEYRIARSRHLAKRGIPRLCEEGLDRLRSVHRKRKQQIAMLVTANDEEYAAIQKEIQTSDSQLLKQKHIPIQGSNPLGHVEAIADHPDYERSANTRPTLDHDQSSPEPSTSQQGESSHPALTRRPRRRHPKHISQHSSGVKGEQGSSSGGNHHVRKQSTQPTAACFQFGTANSDRLTGSRHDPTSTTGTAHSSRSGADSSSGVLRLP
ncbi:hypothetical protein SeLEV6574_g08381 [Synchytrium endobioticum]|uniref:Secreted protein n=1 Tax=Synchytrium endobioticum TaxID=286115 RepID=A0A507C143_9FUNG|nr:hypothetical protein SeLEV6574_g08381 [Synchytrium endobioticum]